MKNSFYDSDIYRHLTGNGKIISQGIVKLSLHKESRVFYLNQVRWAKKLGMSRTTLSHVIQVLKKCGVIEEIGHTYLNKKVYKWVYNTTSSVSDSLDITPCFDGDSKHNNRFYKDVYSNVSNYGLDSLVSCFGVDFSEELSLEEYYEKCVDITGFESIDAVYENTNNV